jgi:hypothetical protein
MRRWLPLFIQTGRCRKGVSSLGRADLSSLVVKTALISLGADFSICIIYLGFGQSTKGDLVNYNARHDQSRKGDDLINNDSINK